MELTSAIREIEALNQASSTVLTTDSRYVCKGVTQRIKGWKDASEQPVKNQDLWGRLGELCETRKVDCRWVKYQNSHLENERANALANFGIYELGEGGCDK
jgi:ribonuclease HI